jgi:hypothetical protein
VYTSEYDGSSKAAQSSSSSWFGGSSWFSSSSSSAAAPAVPSKSSSGRGESDADVVINDHDQAQKANKGPGTFSPFLPFYKRKFDFVRHQQLLDTAGCA